MPQRIAPTFRNLSQLANNLEDDTSIIVKNNSFETRGKIGALFTRKANNRAAGEVLYAGIRQMYGDTVADALAPQIRASREKGKPLTARVARDILATAANMSRGIGQINTDMARHFVLGNHRQGDTRNLDTAFDTFCAQKGIDPAANQALKNRFGELVLQAAAAESQKVLSYDELGQMVSTASTTALQKAWNETQAQAFLDDPVHGASAAMDTYATQKGFDGPQKTQLRKLVGMAVMHEADMAAEQKAAFSPQTLFKAVSEGSLPALQDFACACGKNKAHNYIADDIMIWATPRNLADVAMLSAMLSRVPGIGGSAVAVQRLGAMRTLQPEGLLTRETIWQGCFNEPMPDELKTADQEHFGNMMFERLSRHFKAIRPDEPALAEANGIAYLSVGLSLEKTDASLRGPVALTLEDFVNRPTLTPLQNLGTLREAEESLAKDIKRRGSHSSLEGYTPTISFGTAGGPVETVRIRDTSGMDEAEKGKFERGLPSSMSHDLIRRTQELCGENDVQLRQVVTSMSQAGTFLVRNASPVTGIAESEHSPMDIDIRREANGNITVRYYKPPQSPLDIDYTFTITPDGRATMTACRIQARQPAPQQPADAPAAAQPTDA